MNLLANTWDGFDLFVNGTGTSNSPFILSEATASNVDHNFFQVMALNAGTYSFTFDWQQVNILRTFGFDGNSTGPLNNNNIMIANNDLTMVLFGLSNTNIGARSGTGLVGSQFYTEFRVDNYSSANHFAIGVGGSNSVVFDGSHYIGQDTSSIGYYANGIILSNNTAISVVSPYNPGDIVDMAVDGINNLLWVRVNGAAWNNNLFADPITGIGGANTSTLPQPLYVWVNMFNSLDQITAKFTNPWHNQPPTGYVGLPVSEVATLNPRGLYAWVYDSNDTFGGADYFYHSDGNFNFTRSTGGQDFIPIHASPLNTTDDGWFTTELQFKLLSNWGVQIGFSPLLNDNASYTGNGTDVIMLRNIDLELINTAQPGVGWNRVPSRPGVPSDTVMLIGGGSGMIVSGSNTIKMPLTSNVTYYVSGNTGNNNNSGLNTNSAWKDPQYAVRYLENNFNLNGQGVTIKIADWSNTYVGMAFNGFTGIGSVYIEGNTTSPNNVKVGNAVLSFGNVSAIYCNGPNKGQSVAINGLNLVSNAGNPIDWDPGQAGVQAQISLGNPATSTGNLMISACGPGQAVMLGSINTSYLTTLTVNGAALTSPSAFYWGISLSYTTMDTGNFIINGNVTFSNSTFRTDDRTWCEFFGTISGANVHGRRFSATHGSTLMVSGGRTFFPGNNSGQLFGGAQYVDFSGASPISTICAGYVRGENIQSNTASNGFSITMNDYDGAIIITSASSASSGTFTMCANPLDRQQVEFISGVNLNPVTFSPNAGQSLAGNPGSMSTGTKVEAVYRASDTTWYFG